MALLFKEHTATIYPVSETADPVTKVVPVPEEGTGVEIACLIRPIRDIDRETTFYATGGDFNITPDNAMLLTLRKGKVEIA
jgi:hypothetical protein